MSGCCNAGQSRLALDWRDYMTRRLTQEYLASRTFYQIQAGSLIDNPDQRISADVRCGCLTTSCHGFMSEIIPAAVSRTLPNSRQFTDTALGFSMTILNAGIDLISFSGILYSIYPPLFVALVVYSLGGTAASVFLGRKLVGLNFQQEAQEANFRRACCAYACMPTSRARSTTNDPKLMGFVCPWFLLSVVLLPALLSCLV